MDDKNFEQTLEALWCKDSETGETVLIDVFTKQIIARKDRDGNIV